MSEKTLNNIRIVHKHDTEENWLKATNFIPKQGELIIYDVDTEHNYERFKIGDGINLVNDLPFGSVQSDWNQSDETALDFIKNRTHYEEVDITVLEETTMDASQIQEKKITLDDNSELYAHKYETFSNNIVLADSYNVTLDGVLYENVPATILQGSEDKYIGIGNFLGEATETDITRINLINFTFAPDFTNYQFGILLKANNISQRIILYDTFIYMNTNTYTSVSIVANTGKIHQLDEKFIPDTIARKEDIVVDSEISEESENPVQNKVIKDYVDSNKTLKNIEEATRFAEKRLVTGFYFYLSNPLPNGWYYYDGYKYSGKRLVMVVINEENTAIDKQVDIGYPMLFYISSDEEYVLIYTIQAAGGISIYEYSIADKSFTTSEKSYSTGRIDYFLKNKITVPDIAEIGQILKVKSIDENGKPIEWECVDLSIATDEDILSLLSELEYAYPATSANGEIYISNDDAYYVL